MRWGDVEEEKVGFVQAWCCGGVGRDKDVVKEILGEGRALGSEGMEGELAISSSTRFGSMLKSFGPPRVAKVSPIVRQRRVGWVMMLPLSSFKVMGVWL